MIKKKTFLVVIMLVFAGLAFYSCKKEDQSNIKNLLTNGTWELASAQVYHYIGDSQISVDTLNTACDTAQLFNFNKDETCNYTYASFDCKPQPVTAGTWTLSRNRLTLDVKMTLSNFIKAGDAQPFVNSKVVNLGQFSLVLETGDTQLYYSSTQPRNITRYSFIRRKTTTGI